MKIKLILITFFCYSAIGLFGQKNCIEYYESWNEFDRLLENKDTLQALSLFEKIETNNCGIRKSRYYQVSELYFSKGLTERAKTNFRLSIENGLIGAIYFDQNFEELLSVSYTKYGESFIKDMLQLNDSLISDKIKIYGDIIHRLKNIYDEDQILRRDKKYKECRNYAFRRRLGLAVDTLLNQDEMMNCYHEFKKSDSLILQKFVTIVDSLGFVPDDAIIFGMFPINPIINHTSHFAFDNLDTTYKQALLNGNMSPEVYAWWKGYNEEYFRKKFTFYFTHGEKKLKSLSEEKIDEINERRKTIGLAPCPSIVWNTKIY